MSASSSNSSKGEGNTKPLPSKKKTQISPAKRWCFTLNNYKDEDISSIVPIIKDLCDIYIIGKEIGESGTPHLQGFINFKKKSRPIGIFNNQKIHWEKSKGTNEENERYCEKDGDVLIKYGFKKKPTTINRNTFYDWQENITKIIEKPCAWDCRKIYWYWGDANLGKTQFCKWCVVNLNAVVIGGSSRHILAQVQNQEAPIYIVLLSYGDEIVSYRALEQIKDGLFSSAFGCDNNKMEIRDAPHLIIIGNEPPNMDDRNFHPGKYIVREISEQVPYTTSTTKAPDGAIFCECDDALRDDEQIETQTVLTFD